MKPANISEVLTVRQRRSKGNFFQLCQTQQIKELPESVTTHSNDISREAPQACCFLPHLLLWQHLYLLQHPESVPSLGPHTCCGLCWYSFFPNHSSRCCDLFDSLLNHQYIICTSPYIYGTRIRPQDSNDECWAIDGRRAFQSPIIRTLSLSLFVFLSHSQK